MITKERRDGLVEALENGDPVDCDPELLLLALRQIAELEKDNGIYQDANIRLTKEFEQERATLTRKSRALKREIRNLHRAREQDWEAGKRWRKEFIEDHARLGKEYVALQARIAELEAAAQWRPMATAPKDGTWILVLLAPSLSAKAAYPSVSILCFHNDPFADFWRNAHWERWKEDAGLGWLPIPALPEGGV